MSQSQASGKPEQNSAPKTVDLAEIVTLRDNYLASVHVMDEQLQELTRNRRATAGAVEALTKLIESKTAT